MRSANSTNRQRTVNFPLALYERTDGKGSSYTYNTTNTNNYVLPPYEGRARTKFELIPYDIRRNAAWVKKARRPTRELAHKKTTESVCKMAEEKITRLRRVKKALIEETESQVGKLREADLELQRREEVLALASKAPSVKEMRAATSQLFKEYDLSPIRELIEMSRQRGKNALPAKERMALLKFLAEYESPKPKSVDIQQDTNMNVSVGMVDFRNVRDTFGTTVTPAAEEEEYEEFVQDE